MKRTSGFDGLPFDPFCLFQDGLAAPEEDLRGREVLQVLLVVPVIVAIDEGADLLLEMTKQIVVFQQDAVLERLVPSIAGGRLRSNLSKGRNLGLGLRVLRGATDMSHLPIFQPTSQFARYVTRAVDTEQARLA